MTHPETTPARAACLICRVLTTASVVMALSACTSGPTAGIPANPEVSNYSHGELLTDTVSSNTLNGGSQVFLPEETLQAQWWELFASEELNTLVDKALAANTELQAAEASLRQAQELLRARRGSRLPAVNLGTGVERRLFAGASFGQPDFPNTLFSLYSASIDVSYEFDFFGRTSHALEAMVAQTEYERFRREATYISLTANVIAYAVQEASLREQIRATELIAQGERERLALMQQDFELGALSRATLVAQQAALAELEAGLPPLKYELANTRNQLSVLTGQLPGSTLTETFTLADFQLPREIPVNLPSDLLQQRPDIKMSEALLLAATADLGVASANLLPRITLSGSYGTLNSQASDVFSADSILWNIGAGLSQPLFRGGALRHEEQAAIASVDRASAQYRSTVLDAFADVSGSLQALQFNAETLAARAAAEQSATENLALAEQQFDLGAISVIALLDAQRQQHRSRIALVQAQAARLTDTAALFHALGGGWWNRPAP